MRANITAHYQVLPASSTFSGGKPTRAAWVEWKTPSFALAQRTVQKGFFADATEIIHELSGRTLPRESIFVNVVHAVDGGWNMNGVAMTNEEIVQAVQDR